ncbi:hypothetical protein SAMN05428945_2532 [Streptomyces sp. 2224.1]|uniref:hypothetical protein n=1 Tax=unclassified Streptomyces TaxID=2593676 RepID=UPI0008859C27|nr:MULTISPECIES: hypothetical protein [unclassified Streptomyces]PBC82869.1 hypothetical protein BX261_2783 [Streptomyces sp. 2321.6]SDR46587.1 hypothetical protein SAMN05216511_4419 [Streptomyces sp. KS_16]SEC29769.1 hypothetical protein SAMN05428945_2532 [Streptomyces sp. 2224.1]SEC74885.1 hypothetical protein SAMN05428940_2787 [Streptomyces sp. 2133.1]SEE90790.1 hypothetical protein SAMN05428954_4457 [Streptomyces sp. 2112.3]
MSEITFCLSQEEFAQQFTALPGHEAWGALQTGNGRIAAESPLARVHRQGGSDDRAPAFTLTAGTEPSHTLCTVAPEAGATGSGTAYAVHDGTGHLIGRIVHARSPLGIRQAWRIEDTVQQCSAVAYKGNIRGWIAYWAVSPFWVILALIHLLNGDLQPGRSVWRKPYRARWRMLTGGGPKKAALDFNTGRYRADPGLLNVHLLYAQAALYGA